MKIKTKLIASIMSICLVCAVFAIGVFALKTANLKIGGDVSFQATGVEAHIKNASVSGTVTPTTLAANDAEGEVINTSMTQSDINTTFANWSDIKLDFDENATDIELKFDIANTSTNADNYIEIDYSYSFSNSSPNVDVFPGDENDEGTWENNEYILTPKGSAANATYETFTLKFKVLDKELNVPQDTKVSVNIALKHRTPVVGEPNSEGTKIITPDEIIYTLNKENYTASLSGDFANAIGDNYYYNGNEDVVIAPIVSDGTNNYVVTEIGGYAFFNRGSGNAKIKNITTPNTITRIGAYAFYGCSNLTSVIIPCSATGLETGAFKNCSKLTSINLSTSITDIANDVFGSCEGLTSIVIPSSVTRIGDRAFENCSSLTSITIPSSVIIIGGYAFASTPWYENQPDGLVYINQVVYGYKGTMPENTSIVLREGTVSIAGSAFNCLVNLISIIIPNSVISLGDLSFFTCVRLTSITIPSSVISIGYSAFEYCDNLTSAKFENPTGWFVADSADATEGTSVTTLTADFSDVNANVLKGLGENEYMLRKDA